MPGPEQELPRLPARTPFICLEQGLADVPAHAGQTRHCFAPLVLSQAPLIIADRVTCKQLRSSLEFATGLPRCSGHALQDAHVQRIALT